MAPTSGAELALGPLGPVADLAPPLKRRRSCSRSSEPSSDTLLTCTNSDAGPFATGVDSCRRSGSHRLEADGRDRADGLPRRPRRTD